LVRVTLLPRVVAMCASATLFYFAIGRKDIQTGGERPVDKKRIYTEDTESTEFTEKRNPR